MAKKKQFNKAKFNKKSGILSYNYLGGEAGKGKGAVSIIKQGDDWFFADKNGKVRTDVGINGKLTPTHMNNLKRDGIFAAAKINEQGEKLSKAEIKAGPDLGTPGSSGSVTGTGDLPGASGGGLPLTDRGNLQLAPTDAVRPEMGVSDNRQAAVVPQVTPDRTISGAGSSFSDMAGGNAASVSPASDGTFTTSNFGGGRQMGIGQNTAGAFSGQTTTGPGIYEFAPSEMSGPATGDGNLVPPTPVMAVPSDPGTQTWSGMASASPITVAPGNNNVITADSPSGWSNMSSAGPQGVEIQSTGFGGRPETPVGSNVFNTTQDSTTPGIPDNKNDSSWGSAAGWQAAGDVMKGVGGLASAWTGIQNYKLARDAYNTQKNQWQADYNQRLQAYKDNKDLANQEIEARNRTLQARGQAANQYSKL